MYHFTCERYFSPSLIHSVKLLIVLSVLIVINVSSLVNGGSNPSVIQVSQEPNPKMKLKNDRRIDLVELIHNPIVREKVDIYYLYNISFYVLKNHLTSCMDSNSRAFADCVYNSEKKWGPISDEDIKSTCCSFWEADECLTQLVVSSCTQNQSSWYLEADELIRNKKLLQDDFCSSYQQMSDCDFPFWLVVAIIVSLVILFFICGFAVLNNFMRRESVNSKLTIYNQKSSTVNRQHY